MVSILRVRVDFVLDQFHRKIRVNCACISDIEISYGSAWSVIVHAIVYAHDILSWILVRHDATENG